MPQRDSNVFLVIEPDPTVARDLEETLRALDPRAKVWLAVGADEAKVILDRLDRLSAAFLRLPWDELRSAEIPGGVETRGGRVVVLDVRPTGRLGDERRDWVYTGRPFGADAVARALERIGIGPS